MLVPVSPRAVPRDARPATLFYFNAMCPRGPRYRMRSNEESAAVPVRGIFLVDPRYPPTPPLGAEAYELRDKDNNLIGMVWPRFADNEAILAASHDLLDIMDPPSAVEASERHLMLLPSLRTSSRAEDLASAPAEASSTGLRLV